ncbi:hypothetical protein [Streptomyces yaizuensis]|uniref:FtsK domain-containing protein n=1 Tax=Streptomyces yaizuensis TaxID=2989713 RepID=A0ABQ5P713_9ACTN|nr:hypothetical protein [Streptomyces sp. YSPA8]GLF98288.1 hypothetical protein SYYSPA8_28345 [Streptomyces sp. YSPA8]
MARSEFDRQLEEGVETAAVFVGRFLSGAPLSDQPQTPGGMARWQHVLLRLVLLGWAGWAAWTWWWLENHERVIWWSAAVVGLLIPVMIVLHVRGGARRRHMRTLVVPLSLALKDAMPAWDDAQRLAAVTIPLNKSFVKIALPDGWHGQDGHKELVRELVHARLGGRWSGEWNLKRYPFYVLFQPQKDKVVHEVPERVDFFAPEVQEAIAQCRPGQLVLGLDDRAEALTKEMTGESAMWGLSVGSGGGKSSFLQMIITQLVAQRATVIGIDVKMASINCFSDVPGVHLYTDPGNIGDMRAAISWAAREVEARNYVKQQNPSKDFDRLTLILEEGNEFGDASKEWWNENKEKGDPASDPIWGDIASIMRMGRHVNVTIIGVFQDLRESAVGNRGLRNMFRLLMLGNFNANQWKMIVNTSPVPESVDKAGRMLVIEGNRRVWIQVPYAEPEAFRDHCLKLRAERGYSTADLYGSPPARSPQRLPSLLQVSRPLFAKETPAISVAGRGELALEHVSAGQGRNAGERFTSEEGERCSERFTGEADGAGAGSGPAPLEEKASAAGERPELLGLAEISRRFAERGIELNPNTLRTHKQRRKDFPVGVMHDDGKERFTMAAMASYYNLEWQESTEEDSTEESMAYDTEEAADGSSELSGEASQG